MTGAIGLVPHCDRPLARELATRAATFLADRGVAVRIPAKDAVAVGLDELGVEPEQFADGLDVAISLGGDGTMLRTVDLVYEAGVAVLGVNVGQMGYLTDVEPTDARRLAGTPADRRLRRARADDAPGRRHERGWPPPGAGGR